MKLRYLLFVLLMFFTINVKAEDKCERKELNRLRELARKVEFDYDYKMIDDIAVFSLKAVNLNSDLKVMIVEDFYMDKYKEFKDNDTHMASIDGFTSGDKVAVTIIGYVPNMCSGEILLTKTIKIPYYNYFYNNDNCEGNEDFKYCKLLVDTNLSQKTFDNQYTAYLMEKNTVKENNEIQVIEKDFRVLKIINAIAASIGILALIAIVVIKRIRRNSL